MDNCQRMKDRGIAEKIQLRVSTTDQLVQALIKVLNDKRLTNCPFISVTGYKSSIDFEQFVESETHNLLFNPFVSFCRNAAKHGEQNYGFQLQRESKSFVLFCSLDGDF